MELSAYRHQGYLGANVHYFAQASSTNTLLLQAGAEGAPEGTLFIADEQTAGRGRMGRRWEAPPGTCLLCSLLFRPPAPFDYHLARVPMIVGLAMAEAVRQTAGVDARLKWPNDLIVERDGSWFKLAGLLGEVGAVENVPAFLVVGIGVNVNVPPAQLPALAPNATSLLAESGRPVDRVALLDAFLTRAEAYYDRLRRGWDPLPRWRQALAWKGRPVAVQTSRGTIHGVMEGADDDGALLVRLRNDEMRRFSVGDVTLRPT